MHVILTSSFPIPGNEAVAAYLREALGAASIAWLAPHADASRFEECRAQFLTYGFDSVRPVGRSLEPKLSLGATETLHLPGGSPLEFYEALENEHLSSWLKTQVSGGRAVIAASGGAMLLTENVSLFRLLDNPLGTVIAERAKYRGLGCLEIEVLPHFDRHSAEFLDRVRQYSEQVEHDIWCIPDGAAVVQGPTGPVVAIGNAIVLRRGSFGDQGA
jgi:peptidase E